MEHYVGNYFRETSLTSGHPVNSIKLKAKMKKLEPDFSVHVQLNCVFTKIYEY